SDVVFLFVGRLNLDKGIMDLVKAFKLLNLEYPNAKLLIVGTDEENVLERVEAEIDSSTYRYLGPNDKVHEIMQICDVFCLPSHREAFGLSIIEASACARAILCSDTYGLRDTIVDEVTGLRHATSDVHSIYSQ